MYIKMWSLPIGKLPAFKVCDGISTSIDVSLGGYVRYVRKPHVMTIAEPWPWLPWPWDAHSPF